MINIMHTKGEITIFLNDRKKNGFELLNKYYCKYIVNKTLL